MMAPDQRLEQNLVKWETMMAEEPGRSRLGRGLAALIGDVADESAALDRARGARQVPIEFLRANGRNPRKTFAEEDLDDLTQSIKERGIIQPIIVRAIAGLNGVYEIIAGERRWRAAQRAGLHDVPVLEVVADDKQALEIAIVENVQRADLNALEEAAGYEQLIAEFGYTQSDLSQVIGKSRSHVANTLRLMKLPESVRQKVASGALSAGHARALLAVAEPDTIAARVLEQGLTVRDVERIAQQEADGAAETRARKPRREKDPDTRALEQALEDVLGLKVNIAHHGGGGGQMTIRYATLEQLDSLCRRLKD
jgi:ParB family chromosome partitioning protein